MDFQHKLIKRKEKFGLLWLAAHRPSKLTKVEIIHMDLTKKCNEITEYISVSGGSKKKPILSLLISSHLMKGLVTILHKKNVYLYDELVVLKTQLNQSYFHIAPKLKSKTPKKLKPTEKNTIELKENFPEMTGISSVDSMMMLNPIMNPMLIGNVSHHKNITLNEDFGDSALIPLDYDFTMDAFGNDFADFERFKEKIDATIGGLTPKPSLTSTARKPTEPSRLPFNNITNIDREEMRDELPAYDAQVIQTTINFEDELYLPRPNMIPENDKDAIPSLFEPTVLEAEMPELVPNIPELTKQYETEAQIEDIPEVPTNTIVKTISADIIALKEDKSKKQITLVNRKRKNMIFDNFTELIISDAEKLKRLNKAYKPNTVEYRAQVAERDNLFRERNPYLLTRNDYYGLDLLKQSSGFIARRTVRPLNELQQSFYIRNNLIKKHGNLTIGKQEDDQYSYLVQGREGYKEEESLVEIVRKETEKSVQLSKMSDIQSSKKRNSVLRAPHTSIIDQKPLNNTESMQQEPLQMEQMEQMPMMHPLEQMEQMPIMQPLDSFNENFQHKTLETEQQPNLVEIDTFETIIIKSTIEQGTFVLQVLISSHDIPEKCKQSQKPRRNFASKMFMATLNLAAKNQISVSQKEPYASITISSN